jgi:hypothetical protein
MKVRSWFLIILVSSLNLFVAWANHNDSAGAIGGALPALLIAFLVAYAAGGGRGCGIRLHDGIFGQL